MVKGIEKSKSTNSTVKEKPYYNPNMFLSGQSGPHLEKQEHIFSVLYVLQEKDSNRLPLTEKNYYTIAGSHRSLKANCKWATDERDSLLTGATSFRARAAFFGLV